MIALSQLTEASALELVGSNDGNDAGLLELLMRNRCLVLVPCVTNSSYMTIDRPAEHESTVFSIIAFPPNRPSAYLLPSGLLVDVPHQHDSSSQSCVFVREAVLREF